MRWANRRSFESARQRSVWQRARRIGQTERQRRVSDRLKQAHSVLKPDPPMLRGSGRGQSVSIPTRSSRSPANLVVSRWQDPAVRRSPCRRRCHRFARCRTAGSGRDLHRRPVGASAGSRSATWRARCQLARAARMSRMANQPPARMCQSNAAADPRQPPGSRRSGRRSRQPSPAPAVRSRRPSAGAVWRAPTSTATRRPPRGSTGAETHTRPAVRITRSISSACSNSAMAPVPMSRVMRPVAQA